MSKNQFVALCGLYLVDSAIALENPDIRDALRDRDNARVEDILREQF